MNKINDAERNRFAISLSALDSNRLSRIGLAAAAIAVTLQPMVGIAQWSDNGRALIDAASDPGAYSPWVRGGQPLRPSDISHVLRDWGLKLLSGPTRAATSYQAIVRDDAGQDLFVAVDPYDGRILSLDLTHRALGVAFPRSDNNERPDDEGTTPFSRLGKPTTPQPQGRWKAGVAMGIVSSRKTSRAQIRETDSRRLTSIKSTVQFHAPKRVAATSPASMLPRPSASFSPPRHEPAPDRPAKLMPVEGQSASRPPPMTSPSIARGSSISSDPIPTPPSSLSAAQEIEKQHAKPVIPADAGFD